MRELVYASKTKIERKFVDASRKFAIGSAQASLGISGTSVGVSMVPNSQTHDAARELKINHIVRYLEQTWQPSNFAAPGLEIGEWIKFELRMSYRRTYEDSGSPFDDDDVALFGGTTIATEPQLHQNINLLLCGSTCHLTNQNINSSRMGSDTGWLWKFAEALRERDRRNIDIVPGSAADLVPPRASMMPWQEAALQAHRGLMEDERAHSGYLSGYAEVLKDIDEERWLDRIVLATPLFIESVPSPARQLRRRSISGFKRH